MRLAWFKYFGFVLAVGLMGIFLRQMQWTVVRGEFRAAEWTLLVVAVAIRLLSLVITARRWQVLLLPVKRVRLAPLLSAVLIGICSDTFVAMQSAEIVRPYLLSRWEKVPFGSTFATIMLEWLVDLLAMLVLLIYPLMTLTAGNSHALGSGILATASIVAACALVGLGVLWLVSGYSKSSDPRRPPRTDASFRVVIDRLKHWVTLYSHGLKSVRHPLNFVEISLYSLLSSFLVGLISWMVLAAFGLPIPFSGGLITVAFVSLGGLFPTPGAIGSFHVTCQFALTKLLHIDSSRTILPLIGLHAVLYISPALIGVFLVIQRSLSLAVIGAWNDGQEPVVVSLAAPQKQYLRGDSIIERGLDEQRNIASSRNTPG